MACNPIARVYYTYENKDMNYPLILLGDFIHNTFEPIKGALLSSYPIKVGICSLQIILPFRRVKVFVRITEVSKATDISR